METKKREKQNIFFLCTGAHIIAALSAILIALHLALRNRYELMAAISKNVVRPIHRALSQLWSHTEVSGAECLIGLFCLGLLGYLVHRIVRISRRENKGKEVYITFMGLLAAGLAVYAGFCMLWGVYYYGDDFAGTAGLNDGAISVEALERVTKYFAGQLNEYAEQVTRDENGFYDGDRERILEKSQEAFAKVEKIFPCLEAPAIRAKGVHFSRVMSYLDFTGFFFPFTAEANVNMDFPPALFASTVAHELSHQRGVAKEQEANFTAVVASLCYGDADYCYSACMLAYIHLGNALYGADYEAWRQVYESLGENVRKDMALNNAYWKQFETPVQTVSNTVYEGFLHSYDQTLGLKSYGACVNLLVNYYEQEAGEYLAE